LRIRVEREEYGRQGQDSQCRPGHMRLDP
jgi:hypothetical protein